MVPRSPSPRLSSIISSLLADWLQSSKKRRTEKTTSQSRPSKTSSSQNSSLESSPMSLIRQLPTSESQPRWMVHSQLRKRGFTTTKSRRNHQCRGQSLAICREKIVLWEIRLRMQQVWESHKINRPLQQSNSPSMLLLVIRPKDKWLCLPTLTTWYRQLLLQSRSPSPDQSPRRCALKRQNLGTVN